MGELIKINFQVVLIMNQQAISNGWNGSMKRLERVCKLCNHPKRNHRAARTCGLAYFPAKCHNCGGWVLWHEFKLDNLKYLEEVDEQSKTRNT